MTSPFARLRDSFIDGVDPQAALLCTYGLDAPFFETEILPAIFPVRLNLDREAGSRAGYLSAADQVMQSSSVVVFFDHLTGEGPGLPYVSARVDVKPRAFHPKLILLQYEDRLRVVVSSANLTRPAWTSLLELFVVEDLHPGDPHLWSAPLQKFLQRLEPFVAPERRGDVAELRSALATVPTGGSGSRLLSSWEGPLLARITNELRPAARIDIVTPFFEGEEGEGVLDQLEAMGRAAKGRLFVSAQAVDDRLEVRGPREKIDALLKTRRWTLHRVAEDWDGDQEGAPLRALHGKMLAITDDRRCRLMMGSANITRAALLGTPPKGNVELVVVSDTTPAKLAHLLPQATELDREEIDIVGRVDPTGEDDDTDAGAERWIESAIYWAELAVVEIRLIPGAPAISVTYEDTKLGVIHGENKRFDLTLRESFALKVSDRESVGIIPLVLADPSAFAPRGVSHEVDFEAFCELLAGTREMEMPVGELPYRSGTPAEADGRLAPARGAIPWRRILAAIRGLGISLAQEARFPRGVAFLLRNPTKLAGLLSRLQEEVGYGHFQTGDHAYALHELRRMLVSVMHEMGDRPDSVALVREVLDEVTTTFETIRAAAPDDLAAQLRMLESELP